MNLRGGRFVFGRFWFLVSVSGQQKMKGLFFKKNGVIQFCRGFWQGFGLDLLLVFWFIDDSKSRFAFRILHLVIMDFKCKVFCFGRFASKKLSNRYKVGPLPDVTWLELL